MEDWNKPQLVVLVRGTPEDAILGACKGTPARPGLTNGVDPNNSQAGCHLAVGPSVANGISVHCPRCDSISST